MKVQPPRPLILVSFGSFLRHALYDMHYMNGFYGGCSPNIASVHRIVMENRPVDPGSIQGSVTVYRKLDYRPSQR